MTKFLTTKLILNINYISTLVINNIKCTYYVFISSKVNRFVYADIFRINAF